MTRKSSPSSPERDALIAQIVEKMHRQLREQLPDTTATLDQIEDIAGQIGRQVSQDIQKKLVEERNLSPRPPKTQCSCGSIARYKGQQTRSVVTVHSLLTYDRACYHCPTCHKSIAPLDQGLGLDTGCTTTQVRLWVALLCGQLPFAQAATTLEMLTKVSLSAASMERIGIAIGTSLRQEQHQVAQAHQHGHLPQPASKRPQRLYVGMDGVFVPLRDAWKKDKSLGDLSCRYGECKSGVVYEASQDKAGRDTRVRTRAYVATLDKVDTFAPLLGTLAHESGHHLAKEVVVIGDGAPWIWQIAAKQFSGAVQIVDFFHAAQHLSSVAEARFGKGNAQGEAWVQARCEELKTSGVEAVLVHLKEWRPTKQTDKELRRVTYVYFSDNAERMQYPRFLAKGYHIGSGVVEATCKQVVAQRLDQAGMHWTKHSAEAIVALRAAQLSTNPPDLRPYCAMPA